MAEMEKQKPIDKLGQDILVGSYIAYGHLLDRSAGLRIGKVLDITWKKRWSNDKLSPHYTVWGVDEGWDGKLELCLKKGTLQFSDRIIVLPDDKLPKAYRDLLEPVTNEKKGTTYWKRHHPNE